ncbi:MAG: S1 RNA-binding domain-containing protein [Oscillospiraceae bacterium]
MAFFPEGKILKTEKNIKITQSLFLLREAINDKTILEGKAILCDSDHNLVVRLSAGITGIIPKNEGALGIDTGKTKDIAILSRVNKAVAFTVTSMDLVNGVVTPILSRKKAQSLCIENYIKNLFSGDIINATVTHLEPFGAFVDVGCGICSLIPIDAISISRISHPADRFHVGQDIKAVVKSVENDRVYLSHKELLGTWEENARLFNAGETVGGIVRSVEGYGIFVELAPNLAGLAEPSEGVSCGQHASVYIKSIIPEKMKIKLVVIDAFNSPAAPTELKYFISSDSMDIWRYSPMESEKIIETIF